MSGVSSDLAKLYEDYYENVPTVESALRVLAARESADAIVSLGGESLGRVLDVGAGDGAVSQEIDARNLADEIVALEISRSGIEAIRKRRLKSVKQVLNFDGYVIPFEEKYFSTAVCAHVIEHVEHERLLLHEIGRVSSELFLIAPLEGGMLGKVFRDTGHINYYTPMSLRNMVETSGFRILADRIFPASLERERELSGYWKGTLKHAIRATVSRLGNYAPHFMTHVMAIRAVSSRDSSNSGT